MTATTRPIEDYGIRPVSEPASPLALSHEILRQVRVPEAIYLQDIEYSVDAGRGVGQFLCPRSNQFPNPDIGELTGGQLIDSVTQVAYCLTGLMIHAGVDLLGLDYEGFKRAIHAHRVHAVRTDIAFRHHCRFDRLFFIRAQLQRFRTGAFAVSRRRPARYFVRIQLAGTQPSCDLSGTRLDLFRAQIAACHRLA